MRATNESLPEPLYTLNLPPMTTFRPSLSAKPHFWYVPRHTMASMADWSSFSWK